MTSPPTDNESNEKEQARSKFDFSIEHILKRAGNPIGEKKTSESSHDSFVPFPWLHCTRYCPPKIPREYFFLIFDKSKKFHKIHSIVFRIVLIR